MFLKCFEYNQHFVAMMNVINKARLFPPKKGHKHHIIPKCWFKLNGLEVDNSEKNLVLLSKEDHAKVHKLAKLCVKDTKMICRMAYASHLLGMPDNGGYTISEETKKKIGEAQIGKKLSEETKIKMSVSRKGKKPKNFETLAKINKGKKRTKESCEKMSNSHKGKPLTEEQRKHAAEAHLGLIRSEFGKKFYDHYGIKRFENKKLYVKEHTFFRRHGFCSWEK